MRYTLEPKAKAKRSAVITVKAESITRDIVCPRLSDGLLAFESYVDSWRDYSTLVSIELYSYGKLYCGYYKEENGMGRFSKAYAETKENNFPAFLDGKYIDEEGNEQHHYGQKDFIEKNKIPLAIVGISQNESAISGGLQWYVRVRMPDRMNSKSVNAIKKQAEEVKLEWGETYTIGLSDDPQRNAAFSTLNPDEFGSDDEQTGLGPVLYTRAKGRYQKLVEIENPKQRDEILPLFDITINPL